MKVSWTSPSNIALIKYWGKLPVQLARNSSLSLTLKNSVTIMEIECKHSGSGLQVEFLFEDKPNDKFKNKILKFIESIKGDFSWLASSMLLVKSKNTFPHSSGIASSASSMSALALCLLSLDEIHKKDIYQKDIFFKKASHYARLASGSASRSVFPLISLWEKNAESAISFTDVHIDFTTLLDSILIIDESEKKVSSTAGHSLMEAHPFREARYKQAEENLKDLIHSMKVGDFNTFSNIVENEALTLHTLMMTSTPSVVLLKPESLEIILKIRNFREKTKLPITFTIDAGPNIHVIYLSQVKNEVRAFLENDLWISKKIIHDEMGEGPIKN